MANFERTDLSWANLSSADLRYANFNQANLFEAQLVGAVMAGVNLTHCNLTRANLGKADLSDGVLVEVNMSRENVTEATLQRANLNSSALVRADLSKTNLSEANLRGADLSLSNLFEASERALVTWTAAELARTLAGRGDTAAARGVLDDPLARIAEGEPGSATALLLAEAAVVLTEGDRETALVKSRAAIAVEAVTGLENPQAAVSWWTGSLFGAEVVGGDRALSAAREILERNGWRQAIREPELVSARV